MAFVVKNIVNYPLVYNGITILPDSNVDLAERMSVADIKTSIINGDLYNFIIGRGLSILNPYRDVPTLGLSREEYSRLVSAGLFQGRLGNDTFMHPLLFDNDGNILTNTAASVLPPGAATSANQVISNALLTSINASNAGIDVSTASIDAKVSTEAKQDIGNASLADIDTSTTNIDLSTSNIDVSTASIDAKVSTEAKQDIGNAYLADINLHVGNIDGYTNNIDISTTSIDNKLTDINLHVGNIDGYTNNIDVSTTSIDNKLTDTNEYLDMLLNSIATRLKQDIGNGYLRDVNTKLESPLQATVEDIFTSLKYIINVGVRPLATMTDNTSGRVRATVDTVTTVTGVTTVTTAGNLTGINSADPRQTLLYGVDKTTWALTVRARIT